MAKIPLKNSQTILKSLEERRILKSAVRGKNKYFRLNLDNVQTKLYVLQAEVYKTLLFLEKYPQFKTFLKQDFAQTPLIAFGSFAKFVASEDSDLDLLIISKDEEKMPTHLVPHTIHEIRLSEESFEESIDEQVALTKEVEEHHVILNNHSFYVNTLWGYYGIVN